MILPSLPFLLFFVYSATGLQCMQCGGKLFENEVRISRHFCCNPTPVTCSHGQICLRAYVVSPDTTFFLSGCHTPDDGMIGCDTHKITGNATVHRCTCMDERCQSYFPGNCRSKSSTAVPITTSTTASTTSRVPPVSLLHPPRSQPRKNREEHSNSAMFTYFASLLLFCLSVALDGLFGQF